MASWASALAKSILGVDSFGKMASGAWLNLSQGLKPLTLSQHPEPAPASVVSQVKEFRGAWPYLFLALSPGSNRI